MSSYMKTCRVWNNQHGSWCFVFEAFPSQCCEVGYFISVLQEKKSNAKVIKMSVYGARPQSLAVSFFVSFFFPFYYSVCSSLRNPSICFSSYLLLIFHNSAASSSPPGCATRGSFLPHPLLEMSFLCFDMDSSPSLTVPRCVCKETEGKIFASLKFALKYQERNGQDAAKSKAIGS